MVGMMEKKFIQKLTVSISDKERRQAKAIAKSKGMLFSAWLAAIVRDAIREEGGNGQL